jgi:prophage antirepressor-like protein
MADSGPTINPLLFEGEHLVRTVEKDGQPWFVAADVCRVLGVKNVPDAVSKLDEDEKGIASIDTLGGTQALNLVSEPGVYRLVFTSRKPVAERFKRWLAHDVIPQIRLTGSYRTAEPELILPPAEKQAFPEWPMDEIRTKKGVVDMYRLLYGTMAAQWISPQLGFPSPPVEMVERGRQYSLVLTMEEAA